MYQDFANYYDRFMKNVNYRKWTSQVEKIFQKYEKRPKTVVDLACGTGGITNVLAERVSGNRYRSFEEMLFIAREKARRLVYGILYAKMAELTLHRPVDAILCMCDGFNYILIRAN